MPAWGRGSEVRHAGKGFGTLQGDDIRLTVGRSHFVADGRAGHVVTINGTIPGPMLRLREGRTVRLHVTNALEEDTSVHWHGRSEEHTSELQSLMRISYAVFCLKKKKYELRPERADITTQKSH